MVRIKQTSDRPIFVGLFATSADFLCSECRNILIANYAEEAFFGINIVCGNCGAENSLNDCDEDVILPTTSNAAEEFINVKQPASLPAGMVVAPAQTIKSSATLAPRNELRTNLQYELPHVERLLERTEQLFKRKIGWRKFDSAHFRARTPEENGKVVKKNRVPIAFCFGYILSACRDKMVYKDSTYFRYAWSRLNTLNHIYDAWDNNPQFRDIISEANNEEGFIHSLAMFELAEWLLSEGYPVAFTRRVQEGQNVPDIYIPLNGGRRYFVEIKTTPSIDKPIPDNFVESSLKSAKSAKQITKSRPGSIAIVIEDNYRSRVPSAINYARQRFERASERYPGVLDVIFWVNTTTITFPEGLEDGLVPSMEVDVGTIWEHEMFINKYRVAKRRIFQRLDGQLSHYEYEIDRSKKSRS